ncbi:MAG: hypothetical protein SFT68_02810, partial [Rickettsiaceae bacterium]|nr:hypothetical protein [Rickettsiaceae bacterium]
SLSFPLFFVIPAKAGIQNKYLLDPLFQGDDKAQRVIPTLLCHSHEGENPASPFPGSPFTRG